MMYCNGVVGQAWWKHAGHFVCGCVYVLRDYIVWGGGGGQGGVERRGMG